MRHLYHLRTPIICHRIGKNKRKKIYIIKGLFDSLLKTSKSTRKIPLKENNAEKNSKNRQVFNETFKENS